MRKVFLWRPGPSHEERLKKLRLLEEDLTQTLKNAEKTGKKLRVTGTINITSVE